jgi:hypothetical protein
VGSGSFKIHERNDSVKDLNDVSIKRLRPKQIAAVNDIAGACLDRHGYERLAPGASK